MRYGKSYRCTHNTVKIHVYTHHWTGPDTWYYETRVQDGGNFASKTAALDAAKAAIDKHLEKEKEEAEVCTALTTEK